MQKRIGIYFLANDRVLDQSIALLESLRSTEPDIPVMVIPFDENIERLSQLAGRYRFSFFPDKSLDELDRIGASFTSENSATAHLFRKFAVFFGPFDHFLFLDADIVVLGRLEELLEGYLSTECDLAYFDKSIDEVYRPGPLRGRMMTQYATHGFNSGAFLSSRGVLTCDEIKTTASQAQDVKDGFVSTTGDQPFLNYCMDTKQLRLCSAADFIPDLSASCWAPLKLSRQPDGTYQVRDVTPSLHSKRLPFIHWAGFSCDPYMPNRRLFVRHRLRGCRTTAARLGYLITFYGIRLFTPENALRWLYRRRLQGTS